AKISLLQPSGFHCNIQTGHVHLPDINRQMLNCISNDRKEAIMGYYLVQAAYTAEAVANLVKNPQNRREVVQKVVEKLGGKLEGFWFAFGDYDLVLICEMPDNISAAAFSLAASAGGALRVGKTTPLMTAEEGTDAMKKAGK